MASYFVFFCSLLYAVGFIGNYLVPRSIDVGPESGLAQAIVINVVLLGLFAVQHSVMARPAFKRWWTTIVPASCERSTYVLISSLLLLFIFWQWRPIITTVWHVEGAPAILLTAICWIGWLIALTSSYLIDHFELFGLRQVFAALRGTMVRVLPFKTPLLYQVVRHPLMLGFLLAFWATPHMTAGHLLFAVLNTGYIVIGVRLEERDLVANFGASYERYRQRVPMLLPRLFGGLPDGGRVASGMNRRQRRAALRPRDQDDTSADAALFQLRVRGCGVLQRKLAPGRRPYLALAQPAGYEPYGAPQSGTIQGFRRIAGQRDFEEPIRVERHLAAANRADQGQHAAWPQGFHVRAE
jgi:protein-S-isoprenylcysteine O-methyltransferase Ste14